MEGKCTKPTNQLIMKSPRYHHEVEIISSHHTLMINQVQLDIVYLFKPSELHVFADGKLIQARTFTPSRVAISYMNLIEVAEHIYSNYVQLLSERLPDIHSCRL